MKKKSGRVMSDAERQIIEGLRKMPASWTATRVVRFSTDDAEIARTYGDMMQKRRELRPQATTPPTLGEMFGLASAYLTRCGRTAVLARRCAIVTKRAGEDSFGAVGSPLSLRLTETDAGRTGPCAGDALLLVRAEKPETMATALELPAVRKAVLWEAEVGASGILPTLLPRFAGVLYEPEKLTGMPSALPLERLFTPISGMLLSVAPENAEHIGRLLGSVPGVTAEPFAALTANEETAIADSANGVLRIRTAELRAMTAAGEREIRIAPGSEPAGPLVRIPIAGSASPYLLSPDLQPERVSENGLSVAAATRELRGDCFRAAMATALSPWLSLAAAGADMADIRLAIGLRVPAPNDRTEDTLAEAILGMYRVQTEFAAPAILFAEEDERLTAPHLTVWAFAPDNGISPPVYRTAGNGVYCVTPVMTETGIPDFVLLRRLLTDARTLSRSGNLFSMRTAIGETLGDCLARSAGHGLTCRLSEPDAAERRLPVGLIAEGVSLPFSRIGTTETTVPVSTGDPSDWILPEQIGKYIWSDRYEITVLSAPDDAAANALALALRKSGADCAAVSDRDGAGPVSRRILTSRILILCPNATLPQDEQTLFALRMLTSGGGMILRLGETAPKPEGFPHRTGSDRIGDGFLRALSAKIH